MTCDFNLEMLRDIVRKFPFGIRGWYYVSRSYKENIYVLRPMKYGNRHGDTLVYFWSELGIEHVLPSLQKTYRELPPFYLVPINPK